MSGERVRRFCIYNFMGEIFFQFATAFTTSPSIHLPPAHSSLTQYNHHPLPTTHPFVTHTIQPITTAPSLHPLFLSTKSVPVEVQETIMKMAQTFKMKQQLPSRLPHQLIGNLPHNNPSVSLWGFCCVVRGFIMGLGVFFVGLGKGLDVFFLD